MLKKSIWIADVQMYFYAAIRFNGLSIHLYLYPKNLLEIFLLFIFHFCFQVFPHFFHLLSFTKNFPQIISVSKRKVVQLEGSGGLSGGAENINNLTERRPSPVRAVSIHGVHVYTWTVNNRIQVLEYKLKMNKYNEKENPSLEKILYIFVCAVFSRSR